MLKPKLSRAAAIIFALGTTQMLSSVPAQADPTPSQCVQYSIYTCQVYPMWDALGYSSYGACRLAEYANCMAGVPPYPPLELKKQSRAATVPGVTVKRAKPAS